MMCILVLVVVVLRAGKARVRVWTCDFTSDYVHLLLVFGSGFYFHAQFA
jgi:hypothetical protein